MLVYSVKREESKPLPLTISCLWCGRRGPASAWTQTDWLMLLHLIPLFRWRNVLVQCHACHQDLLAKASLEDLKYANPDTLQLLLVKRVSFVAKTCALLGLLLCWAPLIGIIPSTIAFLMTRKHPGWLAKISLVAFILSALTTLLGLFVLPLSKGPNH